MNSEEINAKMESQKKIIEKYDKKILALEDQLNKIKEKKSKIFAKHEFEKKKISTDIFMKAFEDPGKSPITKIDDIKELFPYEYSKLKSIFSIDYPEIDEKLELLKKKSGLYRELELKNIKVNNPEITNIRTKRAKKYIEDKIENDRMITVYKKYLDTVEYIVSHILYFSLKHQMQNIKTIISDFKIDSGTRLLELDTETSTFYLSPDIFIKIPVKKSTYNVLSNFDHPTNILFKRCEPFVNDLIYTFTGTKSDYFDLNNSKVKTILKNKIHYEKNLMVEVITKWLTFGDAKKYEKHIEKYVKFTETHCHQTVSVKKSIEPKVKSKIKMGTSDSGVDSGSDSETNICYKELVKKYEKCSEEDYVKFGKIAKKAYVEYQVIYSELMAKLNSIHSKDPIRKELINKITIMSEDIENIENNFKNYF